MDNVVTLSVNCHQHRVRKIEGGTANDDLQVCWGEDIYEKSGNSEKRESFITRFRAKARFANKIQSQVCQLSVKSGEKRILTLY